jgi:hypothetical protein
MASAKPSMVADEIRHEKSGQSRPLPTLWISPVRRCYHRDHFSAVERDAIQR